jgi:hypothetical protein
MEGLACKMVDAYRLVSLRSGYLIKREIKKALTKVNAFCCLDFS